MTWTYTAEDPTATAKDKVRLAIGDTTASDQLLQDGEVTGLISVHGSWQKAAVAACRSIAAKFSRQPDSKVSRVAFSNSQKAKAYLDMARRLEFEFNAHVAPWAGSVSRDWKDAEQDDDDRVQPAFARGMSGTEDLRLDAESNIRSTED